MTLCRAVADLPVQEILDRATLAADARWPGASISDLEPLVGGVSSLTFAARLRGAGDQSGRIVVKVAPPGLAPVRNRDVLRQTRVLQALRPVPNVLVPAVLLTDAGQPPSQPPLFVMEYVEGEAYEPKKDQFPNPPSPATVVARATAAARMLAYIHSPEPAAIGLGSEPVVSLSQELERWARLFATVGDDLRHDETALLARLRESIPQPAAARIVHGDYRMGNIQFLGPELSAVIDWEIWSIGDPRTDLAWLLTYTDPVQRFHLHRDAANEAASDAVPHRDELLAEYLSIRPIDTGGLDWFRAYCYYKIASTTAAISKRNRRLPEPDPEMEVAASTLGAVIERGLQIMEGALERK